MSFPCVSAQLLSGVRLYDPMGCSPPGASVQGISQARTLEWVVISFSRDLPDQGIKPKSPALAGKFFTTEPPGKPLLITGLPQMSALWRNLPPTPS